MLDFGFTLLAPEQLPAGDPAPPAAGQVQVSVTAALVEAGAGASAGLAGTVAAGSAGEDLPSGARVFLFGPAGAALNAPDSAVWPAPAGWDDRRAAAAAWLLALLPAVRALRLELGERVLVNGAGPAARLAAALAQMAGAATVVLAGAPAPVAQVAGPARLAPLWAVDLTQAAALLPGGQADALLDFSPGFAGLAPALSLLRERGRALALGQGGEPADFNFYPDVHRRSLSLRGRRLEARRGGAARDLAYVQYLFEALPALTGK